MLFDKTIHEPEFLGEAFPMHANSKPIVLSTLQNAPNPGNLQCCVFQHFLKIIQQFGVKLLPHE